MQSPSHHIPDMLDWRGILQSGWPRKCLISYKTVHCNIYGMWFDIILLKNKVRVLQKERLQNSSQNAVDESMCLSVPLMTTKGARLQKKWHPRP
ncbi:hypothetical protein TNCV_2561061 [Trichonephila clavipes]|uniref:Uncharacterized protein n=1 Tax=Trichonephila clavipes TaxID=2585209 RepID=A0A8X6R526_TRICX|nr:hypothetical protein TNCV_2561061 [Trichonephila clavipes]